jgi:nitrate reductase assembly molybdenum cofactor insertion protein NarJ
VDEIEEEYAEVKVPAMKFSMYRDQWTAGQQKQAGAAMMALISANPTHQDSNDWMEELKRLTSSAE